MKDIMRDYFRAIEDYDIAIEDYLKADEIDKLNHSLPFYKVINAYIKMGCYDEALEKIEQKNKKNSKESISIINYINKKKQENTSINN